MPTIIAQGRASLEAATQSAIFMLCGCLSFGFYVLLCVCAVSTVLPVVPVIGAVLHLQMVLPLVGLTMCMSELEKNSMARVPPKNDSTIAFGRREGKVVYFLAVLKALPPAVFPQLLHLIAFGELLIHFEPELVASHCSEEIDQGGWASVVRCKGISNYTGVALTSAGALAIADLTVCIAVASASFVYRNHSIFEEPPWHGNHIWAYSILLTFIMVAGFLLATLERGTFFLFPWYYYFLSVLMPFLCLIWNEVLKRTEINLYGRAEKLRRLQFETR